MLLGLLVILLPILLIIYYIQYAMELLEASKGYSSYFFIRKSDILFWLIPFSIWFAVIVEMIKGLNDNLDK